MGGVLGSDRVHSTEGKRLHSTATGKIGEPCMTMRKAGEGLNGTAMTTRGSIDVEGGEGGGGPGEDNIMLGFQNLSISCVDPPKHIVANVSGFVVKGEKKALRLQT